MIYKYELENGANVFLAPQEGTNSVTTLVMYPVGSRFEPEKLQGVSHYIEHLMFKGTKKRKNTLTLTREIDRLGAEYNAFTGKEYTGYYIKADTKFSDISFDILSDMLLNSVFDPKEMEREKGPIVEELRMYKDNPIMDIDNVFEDLLYAGCPLGRDIGGTEKHVMSFKRDETLAFRDKFYSPSNMNIIIAGNITDDTEVLLNKYFGHAHGMKKPNVKPKPFCFGSAKKSERLAVHHKDTSQLQMMLGFPAFEYGHKNNYALKVLNTILGGSMSSRLFIKIRERMGLAYTVRSGLDTFVDTGYSYVRAGLEAKNLNKALKAIAGEIEKMKIKGVSAQELKDAKTHIRGGLTLSMEDSSTLANWYARQMLFADEILTPEEYLDRIDKVTPKQVLDVAKKVFKEDQMRLAIIGDVKKEDVMF
ncbi:insulinase family protein [Candidatus Nomurabacteria bacterium]|nr:insulinase family protein [Candidatus Nomurabacteria bacterium]